MERKSCMHQVISLSHKVYTLTVHDKLHHKHKNIIILFQLNHKQDQPKDHYTTNEGMHEPCLLYTTWLACTTAIFFTTYISLCSTLANAYDQGT
jgi:hypothetical protein